MATVEHYWGAQCIVRAIGLKDRRRIAHLRETQGLIAIRRPDPKRPCHWTWYSNSTLIAHWFFGIAVRQVKADREKNHKA